MPNPCCGLSFPHLVKSSRGWFTPSITSLCIESAFNTRVTSLNFIVHKLVLASIDHWLFSLTPLRDFALFSKIKFHSRGSSKEKVFTSQYNNLSIERLRVQTMHEKSRAIAHGTRANVHQRFEKFSIFFKIVARILCSATSLDKRSEIIEDM